MQIEICCENYQFRSGKVALVDWAEDGPQLRDYNVVDGVFDTGDDPLPTGNVRWCLGELVVGVNGGESNVFVPMFPFVSPISEEDLQRGVIHAHVEPSGLYTLTFATLSSDPKRFEEFTFHEDLASTTVRTDENGSFNWLGNPFEYFLELDNETVVTIRPIA
jgi:hypothetical protein